VCEGLFEHLWNRYDACRTIRWARTLHFVFFLRLDSLSIRLGSLGVVGTAVGVFGGGIAILLLPFAVDYVVIPRHC
jgi:hypothetical protein